MKLCLLLFGSIIFLLRATPMLAQQTDSTNLSVISVESQRTGFPVLIDGREVGFTPLQYFSLPAGEHEIAVRRSRSESWLDYDWVDTVRAMAGDTLKLAARFLRGYSLHSTPFGAEVYIDGILQGTTPLVLRLPEEEMTTVEIRKAGYQPVQVQIGKQSREGAEAPRLYDVTLQEEKQYAALREYEDSRRLFRINRNRRIAWATAGVSLASGVAAILLKDKADHFYEQYLTASLPAQRERLYDRTIEYDRYSGIATAVFEVSFAVSFYFFLKATSD
jgi:hypothetical protein